MGWWLVDAQTLADSRFVVSPLAEAVAALKLLDRATAAHPGERGWLDAHLPAYRERLAADPVTALLVRAALGRTWNADFLTPTPCGEGSPGFEEELSRIRQTPPDAARDHLTVSLGGPLPHLLRRADLPERAADVVAWVWTHTVLPDWPRRRRVIEADIVARTAQLGRDAGQALLGGPEGARDPGAVAAAPGALRTREELVPRADPGGRAIHSSTMRSTSVRIPSGSLSKFSG
jgi:hypothetical protein